MAYASVSRLLRVRSSLLTTPIMRTPHHHKWTLALRVGIWQWHARRIVLRSLECNLFDRAKNVSQMVGYLLEWKLNRFEKVAAVNLF